MTPVYARSAGKLAKWDVDTLDPLEAVATVRGELKADRRRIKLAVMAVVQPQVRPPAPADLEYDSWSNA